MNAVFKALSDSTRRKVLQLLRERPMTAGELAEHFTVSKPTMSAHFAVLREAGLVEPVKAGRVITYHLKMSVLEDALYGFAQVFGLDGTNTESTLPRDHHTHTQQTNPTITSPTTSPATKTTPPETTHP